MLTLLQVLQKIQKLLKIAQTKFSASKLGVAARETTKPRPLKSKSKTNGNSSDPVGNLFDLLSLHDSAKDNIEGESAQSLNQDPPRYSATPTSNVSYKLEGEDNDSAFAIWCFLRDLNSVRDAVRETWLEYSEGKISFLTASTVTDTAFGLREYPHQSTHFCVG